MDWLWKLLGYHVCEEFTQWEDHRAHYSRLPEYDRDGLVAIVAPTTKIQFSKHWQERRCTICGKIQQRRLEH